MLLIGVKENNGWLMSRWETTYGVDWESILKACNLAKKYYNGLEILIDNNIVSIETDEEVLQIEEASSLTFRGISTIFKLPITITFYNQLKAVDVSVAMDNNEFSSADYEKFNKSLCQYMNSIELAMNK